MHEAAPRNGRCGNAVETTVVTSSSRGGSLNNTAVLYSYRIVPYCGQASHLRRRRGRDNGQRVNSTPVLCAALVSSVGPRVIHLCKCQDEIDHQ